MKSYIEVHEEVANLNFDYVKYLPLCLQWIKECQRSIEDPSLDDWREEILIVGVKKYKEYIQQCELNIASFDTATQQPEHGQSGIVAMHSLANDVTHCSCSCR